MQLDPIVDSMKLSNDLSSAATETMYQPLDAVIYEAYNNFRPEGAKPLFCYVPFNNMFFSFGGRVLSCPYNQDVELGQYPRQSVHDIWFSENGKKLRRHLEHNDLNMGCQHCRHYFEKQKFTGLKPLVFDKYSDYVQGQYPRVLEFSLSNTCNLECKMCDGTISSSIRKNRDKLPPIPSPYDDKFVQQLDEFLPHIQEAKFYGGEPFLIPVYYEIWDKILAINPAANIFVITNGTCWNSRIEDYLSKGNFSLAVSIDGATKETYENIRKNAKFEEVIVNLYKFNDYCLKNNISLSISFTCQRDNWHELPLMIELCNKLKAQIYVSYIRYPYQLAHWNLPSAELNGMIDRLAVHSFPNQTSYEKHNATCYADYLNYLQRCAEKNKAEEEAEANRINTPIQQATDAQTEVIKDLNEEALLGNADEMRAHLFERIDAYANIGTDGLGTGVLPMAAAEIKSKIEQVYTLVSHKLKEDVFYNSCLNTDVERIVTDIKKYSVAELVDITINAHNV